MSGIIAGGNVLCGAILTLLLITILVGPVGASHYTFQNSSTELNGWTFNANSEITNTVFNTYSDTWALDGGAWPATFSIPPDRASINYIAFTSMGAGIGTGFQLYDSAGVVLLTDTTVDAVAGARYEMIWNGTYWNEYAKGKRTYSAPLTTTTHYFGITGGQVDDLVVTATDPVEIIATIGDGWYARRDFLDPTLTGLYSDTDTLTYTTSMHTTYAMAPALNGITGTWTILTKHLESGLVVNSTTLPNSFTNPGAGNVTYNLSSMLFTSGAPYGLYTQELKRDSTVEDITSFFYLASGADISWDRSEYATGDTATVTTDVSPGYWDTATYTYTGKVIDLYGTVHETWTITTQTQDHEVDLNGYADGDYFAVIIASAGGTDYYMDYDIAAVTDGVTIEGYTVNAHTGGVVPLTHVSFLQDGTFHNSVGSAAGAYNETDLVWGAEIGVNATKTGFNHTTWGFTPPAAGTYSLNLSLLPDYIANHTAIAGIVYEDWSHNAIPGATVRISNTTWTGTSTTATGMGYYIFDNLAAGNVYVINSTASGYEQSQDYSRSPISGLQIGQNCEMSPEYILGVDLKDATTNAYLYDSVQVAVSDGQTVTTTTGHAQFTLDFDAYEVTGYADGYYVASRSVLMSSDRNITLSFTRETESTGAGISYPPHQVKFIVKNMWGAPLEGIKVTAQGYETTAGSWDWLKSLLGMDLDATPIHNATMEGYTGRDGAIVFMMIESVKYEMALTNATQGVSADYEVYPKDDYYEIWVTTGDAQWWSAGYDAMEEINITVVKARVDSTQGFINITYKDALAGTTNVDIFINQSDKTGVDKPDTVAASSLGIASSDFTASFLVPADDESYYVVFGITHSTFGNIVRTFAVVWEKAQVSIGVPSSWLAYMAVFFILFTGMFFGAVTSPTVGAVITCFVGWIMWSLGWLADLGVMAPTALVFATVVSVLSVVMVRSRKERYL